MALQILIDHPIDGLLEDSLSTLVSGRDWDPTSWTPPGATGVWVDPITFTAMLEPAPMNPSWTTSSMGIFAKYGIADFTLDDSGNWTADAVDGGGPFMKYSAATNASGIKGIGPVQAANQAICCDIFGFGSTNSAYPIFLCGYSNTGDGTSGVSFRLYGDGSIEVWKDGGNVGKYSISGQSLGYYTQAAGALPQAAKNHYVTVMFIPCRDREILVVSSMGGGFSHVFDDLPEGIVGHTITSAEGFWFEIPAPLNNFSVRVAKIQFASDGTIKGRSSGWRTAPPATSLNTQIYQALSQAALGLSSLTVATSGFDNPYSIPNPVQLQVTMTGGPSQTPFVYGARAWYDAQTASTVAPAGDDLANGLDVMPYTFGMDLEASSAIGGGRLRIHLMKPGEIDTALGAVSGTNGIRELMNRPFQLVDPDYGSIMTGTIEPPETTEAANFSPDHPEIYDANLSVELVGLDRWKEAEEFLVSDPIPFDGMSLGAAYELAAKTMGLRVASISADAYSFTIPEGGVPANSDFGTMWNVGDRGSDILDRLHQTYAATWFHDVNSDGDLELLSPSDLGSTSALTLYRSRVDAIAAGVSGDQARYRVYRSLKTHSLPIEANDIWVVGIDTRSGRPLVAHYRDTDSANPAMPVASRPQNWAGKLLKYGWMHPTLRTMDACLYCIDLLKQRLPIVRKIAEFECEYLQGIWKGTKITLDKGKNYDASTDTGEALVVRLQSFSGHSEQEGDNLGHWRPFTYVGESSSLVCPLGVHGTSIRKIKAGWDIKRRNQFNAYRQVAEVAKRSPIQIQEVM